MMASGVVGVDVVFHFGQRRIAGLGELSDVEDDVAQLRCGGGEHRGFERGNAEGRGEQRGIVVRTVVVAGQQDTDVTVGKLPTQLRWRCENVENGTTTAPIRAGGEHGHHEVHPVGIQQAHVGALTHTQGDKPAGQPCRASIGLGVAQPFAVADQQRVLAPMPSSVRKRRRR